VDLGYLPLLWQDCVGSLASCLHGRLAWRLGVLLAGALFANGRRTVTSWLRAAHVGPRFAAYYYFLAALGRRAELLAGLLLRHGLRRLPADGPVLFALDDSPTQRYGPHVQGAGVHHNPTPGPTGQRFLYGHVWVTLAWVVTHPLWGALGLPLRVVDGFYAKRPYLRAAASAGVTVISRLRRDAGLRTVPTPPRDGRRRRGRPAVYGSGRISLAKRAGQQRGWRVVRAAQYGGVRAKRIKTFEATWRPAGGRIRVVLVREAHGWLALFSTDPAVTAEAILTAAADRFAIEQDFHDLKEVEGLGQQQLRDIWANIGAFHVSAWVHTLTELWAWDQPREAIGDRSASPWDDEERRPSHADRRKALQRLCLGQEFLQLTEGLALTPEIQQFVGRVINRAG